MKKPVFYYQGQYFYADQEHEFWKWVSEFNKAQIDEVSASLSFDKLKTDLLLNLMLRNYPFTNSEFNQVLEEMFVCFIKELNKKKQQHE